MCDAPAIWTCVPQNLWYNAIAFSGRSSVVEHLLAKEKVMGSNPIARSAPSGIVTKRRNSGSELASWFFFLSHLTR